MGSAWDLGRLPPVVGTVYRLARGKPRRTCRLRGDGAFPGSPAFGNHIADPALLAPTLMVAPDLPPRVGAPVELAGARIDGPFFDATETYAGAVPAANAANGSIPWHVGWTVGK